MMNFGAYNNSVLIIATYNNCMMIIGTSAQKRLEIRRRRRQDDSVSTNCWVMFVASQGDVVEVGFVSHLLKVLDHAVFKVFHLKDVKVTIFNACTSHFWDSLVLYTLPKMQANYIYFSWNYYSFKLIPGS